MKKIALATLAMLASAGCSATDAYYGVAPRFSADARAQVEQAAAEWNRATRGIAQVEVIWADEFAWHARTLERKPADLIAREHADTHAYTTSEGPTLENNLSPNTRIELPAEGDVYQDALHEFGHGLGLPHSANRNEVMYPGKAAQASCVTAADVAAFCAAFGCDVAEMAPCDFAAKAL